MPSFEDEGDSVIAVIAPETYPSQSDTICQVTEQYTGLVPEPTVGVVPELTHTRGHRFYVMPATNLIGDALAVPNLSVEVALGKQWSLRADGMYAWWSKPSRGRYWRLQSVGMTARKYFSKKHVFGGHHLGVFGEMLRYDFCMGTNGELSGGSDVPFRVNPSWGAGVEYGYTFTLLSRLRLDLTIGAGYIGGLYMKYYNDNGISYWKSTHRRNWFGPIRAEVTLGWVIGRGINEK